MQELKENAGNANTKKSTKTWLGQSGLKKKDTARTLQATKLSNLIRETAEVFVELN